MLELHLICHGNVQGVGFRAVVKNLAEENQLTGYVRNLRDGSVEVVIHGEKEVLESFIDQLNNQFEVDEFVQKYRKISKEFPKFTIQY